MSDEQEPWARQPGESLVWFSRFERYRLMWPRSIIEVYRQEWREKVGKGEKKCEESEESREDLPKKAPSNWYLAIQEWQWEERVSAWDAFVLEELEQQAIAEQAKVMLTGYALKHKRIQALNKLAVKLLEELDQEGNLWLSDAKTVAGQQFDIKRFNAPLIQELRATFADLAAEKGERVKKKEIALTELPANLYLGNFDPDQDGVDDREEEEEEGADEEEEEEEESA